MTRIANILKAAPLAIVLTLASSPATAQEKTELEKLSKSIADLKDNTTTAQVNMLVEVSALRLKVEILERQLADKKPAERISAKPAEVVSNEELLRKIEAMSKELSELKSSISKGEVQTKRIDTLNVPRFGKVRFINQYPTEMSITVNGRRYELPPMQEVTVSVPAGNFNYQVLQLQSVNQYRPITENETFTIDIK